MRQKLRVRVGAVVLALATLAAIIFSWFNFVQRSRYDLVDDGVAWTDGAAGVQAWKVAPDSPASAAGIHAGDVLVAINDVPVPKAAHVARRLYRAGLWTQLRYKLERNGEEFETRLITTPPHKPISVENYLRVVGLLYLFIGLFIFARRWNAPRAVHFYVFCLVSFVLYSFQYSGKLDTFDLEIYWSSVVARLLAPALLFHFALVFPERLESSSKSLLKYVAVYAPPVALLVIHLLVALNAQGFVPTTRSRVALDQLELGFLGFYFLAAGLAFHLSYRRSRSGVLRQQLKWLTGGTLAGSVPFTVLYILPFIFDAAMQSWMQFSALSLVLIPLCFGYAIIRYRLMDVDIIFKRGLAYTAATAAVAAVYFGLVALIAEIFHQQTTGSVGGIIAIVVAAFLFQPFREGIQARLDRFFYRDRLDYRRTLIEFGRTLTNEVRLEPMLGSVMDRVSQTLLVDRLAIFVEDSENPGEMRLARSMGVRLSEKLDMGFLKSVKPELVNQTIFFESARNVTDLPETVRHTIEQLDLNYFIPCRIRERTVAFLGLGKTVDGDFLSSDDVELVQTIAGYLAIALDNSQLYTSLEQKALEVARLKDFSENIVESLNVGVLAVDLYGTVEAWNSRMEQLFHASRTDAVGRPLDEVLPVELAQEISNRGDAEQITGIYKQRLQHQGHAMVVNVSITPLVSKSGERIGRLLLFDDVTQRERMEEQMSQTEKLTSLGLLAAGVAHEVNTPLAVISSYIQMLAKQMPEGDPRQSIIEKIVKQTFRASEIVNNLLNFSRTGPSALADVDVNRVVEETLSLVAHPLKTSQIQVVKHLGEGLPAVRGSANKLQQVFLNILNYAYDAVREATTGPRIEISTRANQDYVEVLFRDNGHGISQPD